MTENKLIAAGYEFFVESMGLKVFPHFRKTYITLRGVGRVERNRVIDLHILPKSSLPKNTNADQLEFAIKHDGINPEILKAIFEHITEDELIQMIKAQPTSKYVRKIWFLYEFLFQRQLPINDLKMGNYIDLLSEQEYFTAPSQKSSRHRINNNLLGNVKFCPMVRKTQIIKSFIEKDLAEKAVKIFERYSKDVAYRANQFLYLKETKSSFAIEREQPDLKRTTRFVEALRDIEDKNELTKSMLIELQNTIVDPRFADKDYRCSQNYVGESLPGYRQRIHYISPRPDDISSMMEGYINLVNRLAHDSVDSIVSAATCAFAFVYLHPFEDGNGRLHRLIIHYLLARTGFAPKGIIFPVSSIMLAEPRDYDDCLESFSKPLLSLIDFDLHEDGTLTVNNNTADYYKYFDATKMAEYLYAVIDKTIEVDLINELDFISNYDRAKNEIQEVVDMPDNKIDLLIKLTLDNHGNLSKAKRKNFFDFLTDDEVNQLEGLIKKNFIIHLN